MPAQKDDGFPDALKPYRFHGAFDRSGPYIKSNKDYVGTCPFCGKERAFVAHSETGQWLCHSKPRECGRSGNVTTFLEEFSNEAHRSMSGFLWRKLQKLRHGLPAAIFKRRGVGYDPSLKRYTVPVRNPKGKLQEIRVHLITGKKKKMGTAGRPAGCWNIDEAAEFPVDKDSVLFICEGEWDGMPFDWLLTEAEVDFPFCVVAVPGARTIKDEYVDVWKRFRKIVVMGDNDADGDAMAEKVWTKLQGFRRIELTYLNWPDTFPDGHDLSDQIATGLAAGKSFPKIWRSIKKLISAEHRRMPFKGQEDAEAARGKSREVAERPSSNPTFEETVKEYSRFLKMTPDHILALQFCYAVYLSTQWADDLPLWGFLVGVPGSGKTELLCSIDGCPEAMFYSSIQSKALVSGFKIEPDPSLIPEMIGRCAIFKDWTELLTGNQFALEETYGTLRGAYDGQVTRKFGNGVERNYIGYFNMLAGVTNAIHGHNDSTVGERFLKFQLPRPPKALSDQILRAAMMATNQEKEKNERLKAAALAFLNRDMPAMTVKETIPEKYFNRIVALANLVAMMRAKVDYRGIGFDKELAYRAESELPTRLGKQLVKLAMANCVVLGREKVNEEVYKLVERVAFNTAHGFHLDIVQAAMNLGGRKIVIDDLLEASKMPRGTLSKRIDDLEVLNVLNKATFREGKQGRPQSQYSVVPSVRNLWTAAEVRGNHIDEVVGARRTKKGWE